MPALIPELIAMASDPAVKTADLLRKAKVIAHRCQLSDQLAWIDLEQRGYRESDPLPLYRFIRAPVYLRDVQTGELTDLFTFQADGEIPAQAHLCFDSISKLEALGSQGSLYVQLPSGHCVYDSLPAKARDQYQVVHQLDASQLHAVVAQVRDKVLGWALDLADAGILGEGMTFTPQELQAQQVPSMSIHFGDNATGVQVQLNSPGGQQQQTVTGEQKAEALTALLAWLAQVIAEGTLSPSVQAELQANQTALQALANAPTRSWPVIGALTSSVRGILEGAGGGVLAAQALGWLATLSGS